MNFNFNYLFLKKAAMNLTLWFFAFFASTVSYRISNCNNHKFCTNNQKYLELFLRQNTQRGASQKGFGSDSGKIPRPNLIKPSQGSQNPHLEKFLMMYTCKICSGRNAHMVSKVAYNTGMVIASCRHCKNKHLIADNQKKLDFPAQYGNKIEDYLESIGETVQKLTITQDDIENNYVVDKDGVLTLIPKMAGQPPHDVNIVEVPVKPFPPFLE